MVKQNMHRLKPSSRHLALLAERLLQFSLELNSLLWWVIKSNFSLHRYIWDSNINSSTTYKSRKLLNLYAPFLPLVKLRVDNGSHVYF